MKKLHILLLAISILGFLSCAKDHSNYDYAPAETITVSGLESNYTRISELDKITINPEVKSTDPDARFEYLWGIYETNVQGYAPVLDTLVKTKNIDYLVKQPAKSWVLVFRVTNKNTGYSQYFNSTVNVVTQFTRGWYVAKDNGSQTDLDLFLTPQSIVPGDKLENIYSQVNGKKMQGKGVIVNFFANYKSNVTGILANTRTLFMVSDQDASALNINTLKEIRGFNSLFYEAPAVKAPDFVSIGSSANYFVNDGQCYGIYAMSANSGQFGTRKLKDDMNTPYHLSKYFLTNAFSDPYFFDETSSSFLSASGSGTVMTAISDATGTAMPATRNNKKLLFMGFKSGSSTLIGYGVFQDKTNSSLRILSELNPSKTAFRMVNDTLKTTDKLYNASRYTLLDGDENLMYFVVGNEVWSRNLSNKFEQKQFTAPAGEEITFIRHRKYTAEAAFNYNFVMIGTTSGANYKVRMFTKSSGNLASIPSVTLEGQGAARDVMYISPSVGDYTYNNTF